MEGEAGGRGGGDEREEEDCAARFAREHERLHEGGTREKSGHRPHEGRRRDVEVDGDRVARLQGARVFADAPGEQRVEDEQHESAEEFEPCDGFRGHARAEEIDGEIHALSRARRQARRHRHGERHARDFAHPADRRAEQPAQQNVGDRGKRDEQHPRHADEGDPLREENAARRKTLEQTIFPCSVPRRRRSRRGRLRAPSRRSASRAPIARLPARPAPSSEPPPRQAVPGCP